MSLTAPGSVNYTRALGINDANEIVGDYNDGNGRNHGFTAVLVNGTWTYTTYDEKANYSTSIFGINNATTPSPSFVGAIGNGGPVEAFTNVGGVKTEFYFSGTLSTYAFAINKSNVVVGEYIDASNVLHGFSANADGTNLQEIKYPGATQTVCFGINDAGEITGTYINSANLPYGFTYKSGTFATTDFAGTRGINSKGGYTGFYWGVDGVSTAYVAAPQKFTLTQVSIPNSQQGKLFAINNNGVSVGTYVDSGGKRHGMMISSGTVTNIDDPKGVFTICFGINSTNQIVGDYFDNSGNPHGFLYSGGTFTDIPGPPSALSSDTTGINDAGDIAGDYFDGGSRTHDGFLYKGGSYTTLNPPGSTNTFSGGINATDEITFFWVDSAGYVQSSLYKYSTKKFTSINVPGAASTYAQSINKNGQVVFAIYDPYGVGHGAMMKGKNFYVFDSPKGSGTAAAGINDLIQFVGWFTPSGQTVPQPFQGK